METNNRRLLKTIFFPKIREKRDRESLLFPRKVGIAELVSGLLLDDFNGAFGALHLTCSTCDAVLSIYWNGFSVFHFVNAYRTGVNA